MAEEWYYVENETRIGPMARPVLERLIGNGSVGRSTLVWREGLDDWQPAHMHFAIGATGAAPSSDGAHGNLGGGVGADGLYTGAPGRSFGDAIQTCLSKYVAFGGRASRSEYWFFILFSFLMGLASQVIDGLVLGSAGNTGPVNGLVSLALFLPTLAVSMRRLHDINRSGWWIGGFYLVIFVGGVFVGLGVLPVLPTLIIAGGYAVFLLIWLCTKGDLVPNTYG